MSFALVCIGMIVTLGVIAAVANMVDKGDDCIVTGHDCSTCTAADEGMEEKKKKEAEREA